jgi:hypothetical protein
MHAFNSILQETVAAVDQIPVNQIPSQIPIETPIALLFIGAALLFLPSILGVSNLGASNQATLGTIEHDFQQLGTDIVGIIHDGFRG